MRGGISHSHSFRGVWSLQPASLSICIEARMLPAVAEAALCGRVGQTIIGSLASCSCGTSAFIAGGSRRHASTGARRLVAADRDLVLAFSPFPITLACIPFTLRPADKGRRPKQYSGRYGVTLEPEKLARMRAILGYYDMPTSSKSQEPPVDSVTISLLQTLRYLDLDPNLKSRLLNYRVLAYNRELEQLHGQTLRWLRSTDEKAHDSSKTVSALPGVLLGRKGKEAAKQS